MVCPEIIICAFQSTLPARGATWYGKELCLAFGHFNPRSPHGERRRSAGSFAQPRDFNPRSPHGERRGVNVYQSKRHLFQSTLPARGATIPLSAASQSMRNFNPRSPHGERRLRWTVENTRLEKFQSTLPARGATVALLSGRNSNQFQSTLPARGATHITSSIANRPRNFNPRSPHGERPNGQR